MVDAVLVIPEWLLLGFPFTSTVSLVSDNHVPRRASALLPAGMDAEAAAAYSEVTCVCERFKYGFLLMENSELEGSWQ